MGLIRITGNVNGGLKCQKVGTGAKAGDLATADWGDNRLVAKVFSGVDVGKVDFDGGNLDTGDGVAQGETGMSIGCGIEDDHLKLAFGLLNPRHQLPFEVGLAEINVHT